MSVTLLANRNQTLVQDQLNRRAHNERKLRQRRHKITRSQFGPCFQTAELNIPA
jgi:hypothetical protein